MRGACLAALALSLLPSFAHAKPTEKTVTALVIIAEGTRQVPKDIDDRIRSFFKEAASFYREIEVRTGDALAKKVRRRIVKCKEDVPCVARLGARNKFHEIILARAEKTESKKIAVTFQAISSESEQVVREVRVEIAAADGVPAQMARHFFGIAGITTPGYLEIEDAPASISVDGQVVDTTVGPIRLKPGPHEVTIAGETREAMILPDEMHKMTLEDFGQAKPEPPPAPETPVAAAGPAPAESATPPLEAGAPAPDPTTTPTAEEATVVAEVPSQGGGGVLDTVLSRPLTLAGIGAGVAGVALIGIGAATASDTSVSVSPQTSQAQADRRNRDARDAASRANLMFGIGGGLLAGAVAAVLIDTFVLSHPSPSDAASVELGAGPAPEGVRLWLGGRF